MKSSVEIYGAIKESPSQKRCGCENRPCHCIENFIRECASFNREVCNDVKGEGRRRDCLCTSCGVIFSCCICLAVSSVCRGLESICYSQINLSANVNPKQVVPTVTLNFATKFQAPEKQEMDIKSDVRTIKESTLSMSNSG